MSRTPGRRSGPAEVAKSIPDNMQVVAPAPVLPLARIVQAIDLGRREVRRLRDRFRISSDRGRAPSSPAVRQRSG